MTHQEADVLWLIKLRGGEVTDTALANQFKMGPGELGIILGSLMGHLHIERDGRNFRITSLGEKALEDFRTPPQPVPFEGRPQW